MRKIYQFTPEGMTELAHWPELRTLDVNTYVFVPFLRARWIRTMAIGEHIEWRNISNIDNVPKEYRMMALLLG